MDEFYNEEDNKIITGTSGDDSIYNSGDYCTINTGAGQDLINLDSSSYYNVIIYNSGYVNDKIYRFREDETLSIAAARVQRLKVFRILVIK